MEADIYLGRIYIWIVTNASTKCRYLLDMIDFIYLINMLSSYWASKNIIGLLSVYFSCSNYQFCLNICTVIHHTHLLWVIQLLIHHLKSTVIVHYRCILIRLIAINLMVSHYLAWISTVEMVLSKIYTFLKLILIFKWRLSRCSMLIMIYF